MKHLLRVDLMPTKDVYRIIIGTLRRLPAFVRGSQPEQFITLDDDWKKPKVGLIFEEPSTRTMGSFEEAASRAGFRRGPVVTAESSSLIKGESLTETAIATIQQGCRVLVIRTKIEGGPLHIARAIEQTNGSLAWIPNDVCVINGGDGTWNHPSQALLDAVTVVARRLGLRHRTPEEIDELERRLQGMSDEELEGFVKNVFDNLTIAFIGDLRFSRVVSSWLDMGKHFSIKYRLIAPDPFQVDSWRIAQVNASVSDKLGDAADADIHYVLRIQRERLEKIMTPAEAQSVVAGLQISESFLRLSRGEIMHAKPLYAPAPMIHPAIWRHERVIMDLQQAMGPPTRIIIFEECWRGRNETLPVLEVPSVTPVEVYEEPIIEHLRKLAEKQRQEGEDEQQSVNPIRRGMVLDHIAAGLGLRFDLLLERAGMYAGGGDAIIAKRRHSKKMGIKDLIFLEDLFVPYDVLAALTLLSQQIAEVEPQKMTVAEMKGGQYRHLVFGPPKAVASIFRCPNRYCVTRVDPEAATFFSLDGEGGRGHCHCAYCRKRFSIPEILVNLS